MIKNISNYSIIKLGKKYEDGEYFTISFQRRDYGFDIFTSFPGQEYLGHKNYSEAYYELTTAYSAGYKTIERERI